MPEWEFDQLWISPEIKERVYGGKGVIRQSGTGLLEIVGLHAGNIMALLVGLLLIILGGVVMRLPNSAILEDKVVPLGLGLAVLSVGVSLFWPGLQGLEKYWNK
ncbi:Uncharacterised protein [uncultured archaeon]|nr:Uncharacterised protein [uncultured archaeon]